MARTILIISVAGLALLGAACGGTDQSAVQQFVAANMPGDITSNPNAAADETVTITQNACIAATNVTWNCTVYYTTSSTLDPTQDGNWTASLVVTCNDTECSWPAFIPTEAG